MKKLFLCDQCGAPISLKKENLICNPCGKHLATIKDNLVIFDNVLETDGYFEKHMKRVGPHYENYSRQDYLDCLQKKSLWEMDTQNRMVGITEKFWWERHVGPLKNKNILDLGCGLTYMPLYWANTDNKVMAIDISKAEVALLNNALKSINTPPEQFLSVVADVRKISLNKKFDVIHMANALHHIQGKDEAMEKVSEWLEPDGKLIIVEANYFYPPRWIVETKIINPNPIFDYFLAEDKIEEGERGITLTELTKLLDKHGFKIEYNKKDNNYLGYLLNLGVRSESWLTRIAFLLDKWVISKITPKLFTPFEYVIASRK